MLLQSALTLVHLVAAAPPVGPGTSTESTTQAPRPEAAVSPEDLRGTAAKQLYSEQRYVEAARAYEGLYKEFANPKYLFNAAASHEGAAQDAHAYVALRRFLDHPGLSAEDQARGEARLQPLRRRTTSLQLEITPSPRPAGLELELRRTGIEPLRLDADALAALDRRGVIELRAEQGEWSVQAEAPGYLKVEAPLQHTAGAARAVLRLAPVAESTTDAGLVAVTATFEPAQAVTAGIDVRLEGPRPQYKRVQASPATWQLPPGNWTLEATTPNYRPARASFAVGTQATPVNVRLEPAARTRPTLIVLGTLAGAGFVAGAVVAGVYARNFDKQVATSVNPNWANYHHGTGMMGAGLGLGLGTLTTAFEHRVRRPGRVWAAEVIAGAGVAALGYGLSVLPRKHAQGILGANSGCGDSPRLCDDLTGDLRLSGLADFTGGLGVGLVASGLVGLVRLAWANKKAKSAVRISTLGTSGFTLSF